MYCHYMLVVMLKMAGGIYTLWLLVNKLSLFCVLSAIFCNTENVRNFFGTIEMKITTLVYTDVNQLL